MFWEAKMIKLHSGRDNLDKERYMYSIMGDNAYVLVPNQYTLVAEEQALKYTGRSCLFGIEILSVNRLGLRILKEKGLESVSMLSRNGRNMLLAKIVRRNRDRLDLFRQAAGKTSFTEMLADFASSFKQQDMSLKAIESLAAEAETGSVINRKLSELALILGEYEQELQGRYLDGEDYIDRYIEAAKTSKVPVNKEIWVYGYDSVTPKMLRFLIELAKLSEDVNIVINRGDYGLDEHMEAMIRKAACEEGLSVEECMIPEEYAVKRSEAIEAIGSEFAAASPAVYEGDIDSVRITECANQYYEAEAAAAYVLELLRDHGYRMKDITILCNDKDRLQPVIKRTFEEYGLDIFIDSGRKITDSAPVCFIAALLSLIRYPYSTDNIVTLLKTGMSGLDARLVQKLEIYASKYKVRGTMWTRPLKYGCDEYGEEAFSELEEARTYIAEKLEALEELTSESKTVSDWVKAFRDYLENAWSFSLRTEEHIRHQEEAGLLDDALRTSGSAGEAAEVLEQLETIMGDEPMDREEVCTVLEAGLASVSIGIIPPSSDGISMGTVVRTRPRPARAVLVLGANEGTLPLQPSVEGLFSMEEKGLLKDKGWPLGSLDEIKMMEENTAVHRMLAKPSERLYVSYSLSDTSGTAMLPSGVVSSIMDVLPGVRVEKDIVSSGFGMQLVSYRREAIKHLMNHLKERNVTEADLLTAALVEYFEGNEPELLGRLMECARDENRVESLGRELAEELWGRNGNFVMSASSLQSYKECPFRFFVDKGLRPYEDRAFESDARSIGDVYHDCMMKVGAQVAAGTGEEIEVIVDRSLSEISMKYREGLFKSSKLEGYRLDCIREVCINAAKALALQLESARIDDACFEQSFGERGLFPALEFEADGASVRIEGKIDRADILTGGKARVIDYKTGTDKLDVEKMKKGYRLQLMIYLMSVTSGEYEPAGMFYFNISRDEEAADKLTAAKLEELKARPPEDAYKLRGLCIGDEDSPDLMPRSVLAEKRPKTISAEEFEELRADVEARIREEAGGIVGGAISISPARVSGTATACRFCRYRSICRYDAAAYRGNKVREL